MEIILTPYGGVTGERHGILTYDNDYCGEMTPEEQEKCETISVNYYTDIDCIGLNVCDAAESEDEGSFCRGSGTEILLTRRNVVELLYTVLTALDDNGAWWFYTKDKAKADEMQATAKDARAWICHLSRLLEDKENARVTGGWLDNMMCMLEDSK